MESIYSLEAKDAYCEFGHVDGGSGGRATVYIHYGTEEAVAKLNLLVNGHDYSFINAPSTGSESVTKGVAYITVRLNPSKDNLIRLTGGHGHIAVGGLTVSLFKE